MENLNAEQVKRALECCNKIGGCKVCPYSCNGKPTDNGECGKKMSLDALALIESQEKQVEDYRQELAEVRVALAEANYDKKKLTEENERLRGVGLPDDETYIKLSDAKHAIMDYIGEQTVSKYASSAECKSARGGAEGAMNELDYITPAQVAPIADTVRKMHTEIKERCLKGGIYPAFVAGTINQIAKEMLEGEI